MTPPHLEVVISPRGRTGLLMVRDGTSDLSIGYGTFSSSWATGDDEYGLRDTFIDGVFVDVGAHIGVVSLAVLLDNPDARAILIEPFPENVEMARETLRVNNLSGEVVQKAVGKASIRYGTTQDDRYVGNIRSHDGPELIAELITLDEVVEMAGGHVAAMKIDCEGGEWGFLASKALANVDLIFGEWHGSGRRFNGPQRLRKLLQDTHDFAFLTDVGGIGLFRAVKR